MDASGVKSWHINTLTPLVLCCIAAVSCCSCVTYREEQSASPVAPTALKQQSSLAFDGTAQSVNGATDAINALAQKRLDNGTPRDYQLGPGDILEISVTDMPELRSRTTRISGANTISLPILGDLNVAGLRQDQIRELIRLRLTQFVRDPQVDVSVRQYHSREVVVMGMVQKPGTYTLDSNAETVLDMLGRAGGTTDRAANKIILVPASENRDAQDSAGIDTDQNRVFSQNSSSGVKPPASAATRLDHEQSEGPAQAHARTDDDSSIRESSGYKLSRREQSVVIDLSRTSDPAVLRLPARPGDLIIVPAAGEVMVQGWVRNPGAFSISPSMTVLGAVTAAGGQMFSSSVDLLRTEQGHRQLDYALDLSKVREHKQADIFVQSGDVVIVNKTVTGAVPYLAYSLFNRLGAGIYGSPF